MTAVPAAEWKAVNKILHLLENSRSSTEALSCKIARPQPKLQPNIKESDAVSMAGLARGILMSVLAGRGDVYPYIV